MTYKEQLVIANDRLALNHNCRFVGYGLVKGRGLGTLKNIELTKIIEMPVAENLMIGFSIGLSLSGKMPIVFIERMDFIHNAMDALVNHLDKMSVISRGEFNPAIIIRCIVGNKNKPLYTGVTHLQDYSDGLRAMISFPVIQLETEDSIQKGYSAAEENYHKGISTVLVEYKDQV